METNICCVASEDAPDRALPLDSLELLPILDDRCSSGRTLDRARVRAKLAPWQTKLAKDMMIAGTDRALPLTDIADRLGVSVNHFIRAFRTTVGVTPYQWFMQQRIAQSLTRLRNAELAISTIASEYGFADQSHFTKAFTRVLGVSPGRWRRRPILDAQSANALPAPSPLSTDAAIPCLPRVAL